MRAADLATMAAMALMAAGVFAGFYYWQADKARAEEERYEAALDAMIASVLKTADGQLWIDKLQAAGIPCGRINTVAQALADPHTSAREMVRTLEHPSAGEVRTLGIPFRFSATPASIRRPPPSLSQHTHEVLAGLGYTADEIENLRRDGIV